MPKITEFDLQRAFCIWLDKPGVLAPGVVYWHTPNGGARSAREGARFKQIGVKPGIPDLLFLRPDGFPGNHGQLYAMEWKEPDNGRLSAAQKEMFPKLDAAGLAGSIVVDNLADAKKWACDMMLTVNIPQ